MEVVKMNIKSIIKSLIPVILGLAIWEMFLREPVKEMLDK